MDNMFDFEYKSDGSFSRNLGTALGGLVFGRCFNTPMYGLYPPQPNWFLGGPFNITFHGTVTIPIY